MTDRGLRSRRRVRGIGIVLAASMLLAAAAGAAERKPGPAAAPGVEAEAEEPTATVILDGQPLFRVRGISAYPAAQRAQAISERIATIAADRSVAPDALVVIDEETQSRIVAGDRLVMTVPAANAASEGVSLQVLAEAYRTRIAQAIRAYRHDREPRLLLLHAGYALGATLVTLLLFLGLRRARRWASASLEQRLAARIEGLEAHARKLVQAKQIRAALKGLVSAIHAAAALTLAYLWLSLVLDLFPWTRPLGQRLIEIFIDPLRAMALGFVGMLPDLAFLAILFVATRYLLKLIGLFFQGVERGTITLADFEPEWAMPTYKIVRLLVVVLALVVAYPYIPGSGSEAFKGLSIFLGVVFSLGSSSIIGNLVAGYTMIYRRAFRVGDRIEVGDIRGDVTQTRLLVTHLRTIKNEEVVIPNSVILGSHVINRSTLAKSRGLVLHATVGIGYETPWRQVEAMLELAAERTPGLLRQPPPFVELLELGDFAVTYELNVHIDNPHGMARIYSALRRNILDVFNEHGVQIMTPAYEGDPEQPKVVAKEQWFAAPAVRHGSEPDTSA
jgi:small-conductance mechanosensitive channel